MKSNALKPNEGKLLIESRLEVNYPSKQNVYGFLKKHIVQNVQIIQGLSNYMRSEFHLMLMATIAPSHPILFK